MAFDNTSEIEFLAGAQVRGKNERDRNIPPDRFDFAAVAHLQNLRTLSLAANGIEDAEPLGTLTALEVLSLAHTRIADITPLFEFGELEQVSLNGVAGLPCSAMKRLVLEVGADGVVTDSPCAHGDGG